MISQKQLKVLHERGLRKRMNTCSGEDLNFCCPNYHYGGSTGCDLCVSGPWGKYIADTENSNMRKEWLDDENDYSIELHKKWLNRKKDDIADNSDDDKRKIYQYIESYVSNNLVSCLPDGENNTVKPVLFERVCNGMKNIFDRIFENTGILHFQSSFISILESEMFKETGENCSFDVSVDDIYQQFLLWFDLTENVEETDKSMKYHRIHQRIVDMNKMKRTSLVSRHNKQDEVIEELNELLKEVKIDTRERILLLVHSVFNSVDLNVGGETETHQETKEAIGAIIPDEKPADEKPADETDTVKSLVEKLVADLKRNDSSVSMALENHTCNELPTMKGVGESFVRDTPLRDFYLIYLQFFYCWNFEEQIASKETKDYIKGELKKFGITQIHRVKWYVSIFEAELPEGLLTIFDKDEDGNDCEFVFSIELYLQFKAGEKFEEPKELPVGITW
jgi:hypothetical protein